MSAFLADWFEALWMVLAESGPYLLVGFVIAGFLAVWVPTRWIARRLGGDDVKSVATAAVIGVPVPLCSCSVIPTATQLRRSGASRGATTSFLIATPETGVDSIGATWALMDPLMTIVRPVAAFVTAFAAGVAVNLFGRGETGPLDRTEDAPESTVDEEPDAPESCCSHAAEPAVDPVHDHGDHAHGHDHDHDSDQESGGATSRALRYAFGTLLDDLTPWFLIGFALSAAIVVFVPDGFFAGTLVTGWAAMLAMLVAGVPLYVCATASTPIAAAMMAKGLEPGAALVFLLAGPATNVATILVVRNLLGKRALVAYLASIAAISLLLGAVVNALYPLVGLDPTDMDVTPGSMDHGLVANVAGAVLALLLARSAWRLRLDRSFGSRLRRLGGPIGLDLTAAPFRAGAALALALAYASTALTVVGPGETVFVERFGRVAHERTEPGAILHAPWPIDRTARVSTSQIRSVEFGIDRSPIDDSTNDPLALRAERQRILELDAESETLTGDGLLLSVRYGIQYRIADARAWRYGQSDPEGLVARIAQDALRRVVATLEMDAMLVGANQLLLDGVQSRIAADFERSGVGATLVAVLLHDVHAPPNVHDAYRQVASALEDAVRVQKSAQVAKIQLLSEARSIALERLTRASSDSARTLAQARGEAAAFDALVAVHAGAPARTKVRADGDAAGEPPLVSEDSAAIVERAMLLDAYQRALRPAEDGARRIVLPLGDSIEVILTGLGSTGDPPPSVFDGAFTPPR